jgi:hypothetical protein
VNSADIYNGWRVNARKDATARLKGRLEKSIPQKTTQGVSDYHLVCGQI